jgi:hypothetical protein
VIGTTCAALACVGAGRLPSTLRLAIGILATVALVSWPARVLTRAADPGEVPRALGIHDALDHEYRWSTGYAVIFLPNDARAVTLPLRNLSPHPQRVRVYLDGRPADERVLPHGPWHELRYDLPVRTRGGPWRRLTFAVDPTWQGPDDPRTLGVLVGQWRVERRE